MVEMNDDDDDDDSIKKDHCGGVDDDEEVVVDIYECSSVDDKIEIEVSEECNDDDDTNDVFCSSSSPFSGTVSLVRNRKPRNLDVEVKEETNKTKRRRVSKEKPKSNASMPSRPNKRPNRQRKRGKRRSGSAGSRKKILKMVWEVSIKQD
ncbi:hypothetical protein F2Q70_00033785 [Brassica cretica]|uniref:Uncharacterized protein n=1 Tax=Brassica cretica TaxID=69181 RepID=A0A8S9G623_BRACR|nr:hypothetical protein F2Q68_00028665 [Brassica cretica]KAF2586835.1 hypothetical protein F2Q70_00033785 [Brassica cretica]